MIIRTGVCLLITHNGYTIAKEYFEGMWNNRNFINNGYLVVMGITFFKSKATDMIYIFSNFSTFDFLSCLYEKKQKSPEFLYHIL